MSTKPPECWATDASAKALRLDVSLQKSLLLKFDHLIYAEIEHHETEQQLRLFFTTHEVTIRGHGFRRLETAIQRLELSQITCIPANYHSVQMDGQPVVREILVTESLTPNTAPNV